MEKRPLFKRLLDKTIIRQAKAIQRKRETNDFERTTIEINGLRTKLLLDKASVLTSISQKPPLNEKNSFINYRGVKK